MPATLGLTIVKSLFQPRSRFGLVTLTEAHSRWEAAEQALLAAERFFEDAVYLYLVRGGPDPSGPSANVCQVRLAAAAALKEMLVVLEECRQAIRTSHRTA